VGLSGPGVSATFVYDGLGRREKKTINSSVTEFLYNGVNPVQETSGATVLANILTGLGIDEFLTRTDVVAGVTSSFLTDALGSPVAVTDNAGAVQTEYTYEPFGKTTFSGASNSSSYQYTGRENDGPGLYYYRARYYHPQLQRFISEDPIEFDGGDVDLYTYVKNSPLNFIDPEGLRIPMGGYKPPPTLRPPPSHTGTRGPQLGPGQGQPAPRWADPTQHPGPKQFNKWWEQEFGRPHPHTPHDPHIPHPHHVPPCPPWMSGICGPAAGLVPPMPVGSGRKDPNPIPGCGLGLSLLCPDTST
jgi:RHS repeat-associated protein